MTQRTSTSIPSDGWGRTLPLRVVDESWRHRPGGSPPPEWLDGLWSLDSAVRRAVAGGWTEEDINHEVRSLTSGAVA